MQKKMKCKKRLGTIGKIVTLIMMFAMMLQTPEEAQAAVVKKNFEEVVVVKTEPGTECGNFGCLALDGKGGLYALKTDTMEGHTQYSNLYYFKNYKNYKNTKEFKRYRVDQSLDHGNGMTYRNGYLYVAAGNHIAKMTTKGVVKAFYTIDNSIKTIKNQSASSITCYKSDTYIVGLGKKSNTIVYGIGKIENKKFKVTSIFSVNRDQGYDMTQDICYAKKCLYIVTSQSGDPINKNRILCVNTSLNGTGIIPDTVIEVKKPKKDMDGNATISKFEAEGIGIETDGTILISANCEASDDGVFLAIN